MANFVQIWSHCALATIATLSQTILRTKKKITYLSKLSNFLCQLLDTTTSNIKMVNQIILQVKNWKKTSQLRPVGLRSVLEKSAQLDAHVCISHLHW